MTDLLNPTQTTVFDQLRGDIADRPSVRREFQKELQAELEAALRPVVGPLSINKGKLNKVHDCEGKYVAKDEFGWTVQSARGTIAHKAVELSVDGTRELAPQELVSKAIDWIVEGSATQSLADYVRSTGDAERAELRNSATDMVIKFLEMFPPLKPNWHPNAEATTGAVIGAKRVIFQGKIDLKLGALQPDRSSTLIIDIKTGNPSFKDLNDLRFYALLETLRTGVPPYRWANAYVSMGRAESEDVTEDILWSAARRAADGTLKIHELNNGREPVLTPGGACKFCPARDTCPESQAAAVINVDESI